MVNASAEGVVTVRRCDGLYYVLEDASLSASPERWAERVVAVFDRHQADNVVLERNFGGDLGLSVLQRAHRGLPVKMVTASRGKHVRAEPIALLYEQGKVKRIGAFPQLEDQLCAMRPDGYAGAGSPDRRRRARHGSPASSRKRPAGKAPGTFREPER